MAKAIATITGVALAPGVSRNNRLYTKEAIGKMVARASERIAAGTRPIAMYASHDSMDVTGIGGSVTRMWQEQDGSAHYAAEIPDTPAGRAVAALVDPEGGRQFLRGVSILGNWVGPERSESHAGSLVSTGDDFELGRLDFTSNPGVDAAGVDDLSRARKDGESGGYSVSESAPEALVTAITEETPSQPVREDAPAGTGTGVGQVPAGVRETLAAVLGEEPHVLENGLCVTCGGVEEAKRTRNTQPYGNVTYADPGYQKDKVKRYPLDSRSHIRAAWSYVNMPKNAAKYTSDQLKRIKGRIKAAMGRIGAKVSAETAGLVLSEPVQVSEAVAEWMGDDPKRSGSWCVSASNGPVNLNLSSYCMDPADLDVILRAAADAACKALAALDPDMDGDIDVPGADSANTDHDGGHESAPEAASQASEGHGTISPQARETTTEGEASVSAETTSQQGGSTPPAITEADLSKARKDAAREAVDQYKAEQKAARKAAKKAAREAAQASGVTETSQQQGGTVTESQEQREARLIAAALKAAGVTPKAEETEEQRVERLVGEGVQAFIQEAAASGAILPGRAGIVIREHATDPDKAASAEDLAKMSDDDFSAYAGANLDKYVGDHTRVQALHT